ncbi:unnamed protein product [Soboliphyme baturini]|uniref:Phage minor tail protein L n=1 Tax=Soboliphyme baturini TaxID=241478 RepID=A0A183J0H2_9BILA|nr:unnamed protein product [Soboliphyme baturini]
MYQWNGRGYAINIAGVFPTLTPVVNPETMQPNVVEGQMRCPFVQRCKERERTNERTFGGSVRFGPDSESEFMVNT